MKLNDILPIAVLGVGAYILMKFLPQLTGETTVPTDTGTTSGSGTADIPAPYKYSSQWFMNNQYYDQSTATYQPYNTQVPVTVTEPDVSPGIPTGYVDPIYVGQLTELHRFPGDTDVITQCVGGNLQGGSSASMQYLLYSTDAAAVAWRARYCS